MRYGSMFGPNITFLGIPECDVDEVNSYKDADVVIIGAPFDGGTSYRSGARLGPSAIRGTDYLPHDGSRPHLATRMDGLKDIVVKDAGDVEMFSGDINKSCAALEVVVEKVAKSGAIPVIEVVNTRPIVIAGFANAVLEVSKIPPNIHKGA
mgnify:CR=1 FL=1